MSTLRTHMVATLVGFVLAALALVAPAAAQSGPFCSPFSATGLDGWAPCAAAPNISVTTSNDSSSKGGQSDWYLKLTDQSGASAACSADPKYLGNWVQKLGSCAQFCFDIRIIEIPLAPNTIIHPSFTIYGSGSLVATFVSNIPATTDSGSAPGWHHLCAPVRQTQAGEDLPSDATGAWKIGGSSAPNPQWNQIIGNVTRVQLPVDFTPQPSEVVGYDNICMGSTDCSQTNGGGGGGGGGGNQTPPVDCLKDINAQVKCNPDGSYTLTTSGAGLDSSDITMISQTAGVTVVPQQQPAAATMTWTLVGATAGEAVTLLANATKRGGGTMEGTDSCCSGTIKLTMPDCPKPVDVKIEKSGGTTPAPQVGLYDFMLKVTNVGASFNGSHAIVVTDVVPAGMIFNSASGGPNWSCTSGNIPAGGTLSCLYTGPDPTGPNQDLGTITIGATATGSAPFPPFTNCATVGFNGETNQVDANTLDNRSCVTVSKPATTQVCPQGTILQGRECVKRQVPPPPPPHQACAAPMVAGATPGSCVCPQGTTLQGRECVKTQQPPQQQACAAPMIQGAAPGVCVCPQGTVQQGRDCVAQQQQHTVPQIPFGLPKGFGIGIGGGSGGGSQTQPHQGGGGAVQGGGQGGGQGGAVK